MGPIQNLADFLSLLRRRRLLIAAIVLLGAVLSVLAGLSRPKVYMAWAVIQVESPVVAGQDSAAGTQSARLLQVLEQQLTTRENMLAVAARHGLFADAPGLADGQKVTLLRDSINFESIASVGQPGGHSGVSALLIGTRLPDPDQAARVANDLAQSVLDLAAERQSGRARENVEFFRVEEARVSQEILALEAEIAAWHSANPMPRASDSASDRIALETSLRGVTQEILAVEAERAALQAKDRLRETDRRRIDELTLREDVLQSQKAALEAQLAEMQERAARTPEAERALASYDRRMELLQAQLEMITARKTDAETAWRLEQENRSEHFSMLERAIVPELPVGGGGRKIALAGTIASLIAAIGLAFLLDLFNPVLRSAAQMERELGIRPVITLPELPMRRRRRGFWRGRRRGNA